MLVLTRKEHEKIVIGDPADGGAIVEVLQIRGDKVRLGITADQAVPVNRVEVQGRIDRGEAWRGPRPGPHREPQAR